jgi:hypothetical protein
MFIANPLYDVVFKYMMEDNKVAKKFISVIIGEDVIELDFADREPTAEGLEPTVERLHNRLPTHSNFRESRRSVSFRFPSYFEIFAYFCIQLLIMFYYWKLMY